MSPANEPNPMTIATTETLSQKSVHVFADTVLASIIFWTPDVLVHALSGRRFSGLHVTLLTVLLPACSGFGLVWIWKKGIAFKSRLRRIVLPVLGVWLFGPLMMMISATFSLGGVAKPGIWQTVSMMTLTFPISTFIGSTYDGTLGAVLLATLCLPILGLLIAPDLAITRTAEESSTAGT
jgi:hypothetical protein